MVTFIYNLYTNFNIMYKGTCSDLGRHGIISIMTSYSRAITCCSSVASQAHNSVLHAFAVEGRVVEAAAHVASHSVT